MAKTKSENNIQETSVKTKSKKSKVKDEPLESKVSQVTEPLDNIQVDVEIDCRSDNHSDVVNGYIRRKRSI